MYTLSKKENKRRNYILQGPLWKVIITISAPLAIYGLFNYLYGFFDLLMVSHIGGNEVASVVFIDEIKNAMMAFGAVIAMKLGGGPESVAIIFEESETSIISQNLGNKQLKRSMHTYLFAHLYALVVGGIGLIIVSNMVDMIIPLFTTNTDPVFQDMILDIYFWDKFSVLTSSSIAVITGLFIGFKFTKVAFILNVVRLFVFRLPVLWLLQYLGVGYVALGYVVFISNLSTLLVALIFLMIFVYRIRNDGYMDLHLVDLPLKS